MHKLKIPLNGDIISKLKVGDEVLINGWNSKSIFRIQFFITVVR